MGKQVVQFEYEIISNFDDLINEDKVLMEWANKAKEKAYAPYSNFKVGAALVDSNGKVFMGANMENASFPICICAEGALLTSYNTDGAAANIESVAITASSASHIVNHPVAPCGACRQMLSEMEIKQKKHIRLILMGESGPIYIIKSIKDILPIQFTNSDL